MYLREYVCKTLKKRMEMMLDQAICLYIPNDKELFLSGSVKSWKEIENCGILSASIPLDSPSTTSKTLILYSPSLILFNCYSSSVFNYRFV